MSQIVRETRHSPLVFATLTFISFIAILYSNDFYLVFSPSLQRHQLTTLHDSTPSFVDFQNKSSNETSKVMIPFAVGKAPEECDIFSGKWIRDTEDRPLYEESECPYIHSQLLCQEYGRPDKGYQSWRWQPHDCNLPKFNATLMLEALRGKRMLFVGDSLMRGQFESMICLVHRLVPENGKSKKGSYESLSVFSLKDYNATIEFYWAPFLLESNGDGPYNSKINESIIRKGSIDNHGKFWEGADVVSFGTYLWWFNQLNFKIVKGSFSDEVSEFEIMKNEDAYRMAIKSMLEWVQRKMDQKKTRVFFTSMSPTHRRSIQWGGEPDGNCYNETTPIQDPEYNWRLSSHEIIMKIIDEEFGKSSVPISLLNITLLSSYRKDAHTQIYKKQWKPLTPEQQADPKSYADCVHWCLPGLHDTWNELLFAKLFYP